MVVFIFKVESQILRSLDLYKNYSTWILVTQDIARTMLPKMIKLSMYTSYGKRKKPTYFQGHPSCHSERDPRFSAHQYHRGIFNGDALAPLHQVENQPIHVEVGIYTYRFGHAGDGGLLLKLDFTIF